MFFFTLFLPFSLYSTGSVPYFGFAADMLSFKGHRTVVQVLPIVHISGRLGHNLLTSNQGREQKVTHFLVRVVSRAAQHL